MVDLVECKTLQPGIISVLLNRPERRNALGIKLLDQLREELTRLADTPSHRVVILRGAGPVFSAGLDLHEAAERRLAENSAQAVHRVLKLIRETPLIVIAAVHGAAMAGGAGLMAACDITIATADAKFSFPEARRGLLPALISDVLRHKVREGDLRDLFLSGNPIDAKRAQQIGLVQRVVPPNHLLDEAIQVAQSIIAGGPETIRHTKILLNEMYGPTPHQSGLASIQSHLAARQSAEAREGLAAFAEKRTPKWT